MEVVHRFIGEDEMPAARFWKFLFCASLVFLFLLTGPCSLCAQNSRGTILGHVTDPTCGAVLGAKVTVRNADTSVSNTFLTNSDGD